MNRLHWFMRQLCAFVGFGLAVNVWADDVEIYYSAFGGSAKPMVMLTLDLRSNLGSTECSSAASASCAETLGDELYQQLDLMTRNADGSFTEGGDGIVDLTHFAMLPDLTSQWLSMGLRVSLFDVLRAAIRVVLTSDVVIDSGIRIGLMVSHDDTCTGNGASGPDEIPAGTGLGCSNGAYVLKGFFDVTDTTERDDFFARLGRIPQPSSSFGSKGTWSGHPYQLKEIYFEFYRYITGQSVYNGYLSYDDFNSGDARSPMGAASNDIAEPWNTLLAPDTGAWSAVGGASTLDYQSPFEQGSSDDWACSRVFMVNTLFGTTTAGDDSDDAIKALRPLGLGLSDARDETDIIAALKAIDVAPNAGEDYSGTLPVVEGDQSVTSYFISDTTNRTQDEWARAGGTDNALSLGSGADITAAFAAIFNSIITESSTLVAASVPVNVFNRAETYDNVFLALFQVEEGARWPGNIKKLKIGRRSTTNANGDAILVPEIQDVNSQRAFDATDGRIVNSALTYWTDASLADVVTADPDLDEISGRDGHSVKRGGAGQQLPGTSFNECTPAPANSLGADCTRNLYVQNPSDTSELVDLDSSLASGLASALLTHSAGQFAGSETQVAIDMIAWMRGLTDLDAQLSDTEEPREWLMGDVLHSKPLPMNYGDSDGAGGGYSLANPNIRLFFGSNDGWLRQVKNTEANGTQSGHEVWAFMPQEVLAAQYYLASNMQPAPGYHPYGVDAEVSSLLIDRNRDGSIQGGVNDGNLAGEGDKAIIFFGLRRGGKAVYALDVSDPDAAPHLMWSITPDTAGFERMGLTFSKPVVTQVRMAGRLRPVLIFGAGYHGGWSADYQSRIGKDVRNSRTTDDIGNDVYVVDAQTGALLWSASRSVSIEHSVASNVTVADVDLNGVTDIAYVGDTGGNVWRLDFPEDGTAWSASLLAELGGAGASDRRFFHAPDVVFAKEDITGVDAEGATVESSRAYIGVVISSGDRANPRGAAVNDFVYMIKDTLVSSGDGDTRSDSVTHADLLDITAICGALEDADCEPGDLPYGWKLSLGQLGEKGLASPITAEGVSFFTTYLPEGESVEGQCAPGVGSGRLYAVAFANGSPVLNLQGDSETITLNDRYTILDSPGIPAGITPIAVEGRYGILVPGGDIRDLEGRFLWRAYFRELGLDDL